MATKGAIGLRNGNVSVLLFILDYNGLNAKGKGSSYERDVFFVTEILFAICGRVSIDI